MKWLGMLLVCLLIPVQSWAFPDNAVLDTFSTGSDNDSPPNSNWTNGVAGSVTGTLRLKSTGVTNVTNALYGDAYWDAGTFASGCEAYATLITKTSTTSAGVFCRLTTIGSNATDGYAVFMIPGSNQLRIYRLDDGTLVPLTPSITQTITVGDSVGIRTVGNQICAWYKVGAGIWVVKECRTDGIYATGGAIGLGTNGTNTGAILDDFGGGTATSGCSGSTPTWTALSAEWQAVSDCIAAATPGDTINVPAGTGTWQSGTGNLSTITKSLQIIGAGEGVTNITLSSHLSITGVTDFRLSAMSMAATSTYRILCTACVNFRFDHLTFTRSTWTTFIEANGNDTVPPTGLIDHNTVTDGRLLVHGQQGSGSAPYGSKVWSDPLDMGTANAVYVEDNVFNHTSPGSPTYPNTTDGSWGMRVVFRFNTFNSGRIEAHGVQAYPYRGARLWEYYGNAFKNDIYGANYGPFLIRGGTGVAFHNTTDGGFAVNNHFRIDGPRQENVGLLSALGSWAMCDGNSVIDENTATFEGWLCRDQIGASTDASQWIGGTTTPAAQAKFPAYFWKNTNTLSSTELLITYNCASSDAYCTRQNTLQILNNRDYYQYNASFNGMSGVGEGTLAARPAMCTTGVAYWATDQGSWNTSVSNPQGVNAAGADGLLYRCTPTNTWTVAYTPYTYPHPLQGVAAPAPDAPTGLRLMTQASANSACLLWAASDLSGLLGYRVYHGTVSGVYDLPVTITATTAAAAHHPVTQYCYQSAIGGTHYFSVTAYNAIEQSAYATEVSTTFTALARDTASARGGSSARDPLQ